MGNKQIYSTSAPWEAILGYSRAVRIGNVIEVTGTTSVGHNGEILAKGDAYGQAKLILEKIGIALQALGGTLEDVARTRMYVTDISRWEEVGRAHGEYFKDILPATSMVEVKGLIDPDMLVEIEATAYLS
jgi:enamine deaminase RidA (YjgF/YER057c/UK114 family)